MRDNTWKKIIENGNSLGTAYAEKRIEQKQAVPQSGNELLSDRQLLQKYNITLRCICIVQAVYRVGM